MMIDAAIVYIADPPFCIESGGLTYVQVTFGVLDCLGGLRSFVSLDGRGGRI
jgi:hypothetical protein